MSTCANCGRALVSADKDHDHCPECDEMYRAGVEAAIAAMRTSKDLLTWTWFTLGDRTAGDAGIDALAAHVRKATVGK